MKCTLYHISFRRIFIDIGHRVCLRPNSYHHLNHYSHPSVYRNTGVGDIDQDCIAYTRDLI